MAPSVHLPPAPATCPDRTGRLDASHPARMPGGPHRARLAGAHEGPAGPGVSRALLCAVPEQPTVPEEPGTCNAEGAETEPPLTSEPPLADAAPLTSEPPLSETTPLTGTGTDPSVD